jgi:hypothetical protein
VERGIRTRRGCQGGGEVAHWGEEENFHVDQEQVAILASFNTQRFRRIDEQALAEIDATNFKHSRDLCYAVDSHKIQ